MPLAPLPNYATAVRLFLVIALDVDANTKRILFPTVGLFMRSKDMKSEDALRNFNAEIVEAVDAEDACNKSGLSWLPDTVGFVRFVRVVTVHHIHDDYEARTFKVERKAPPVETTLYTNHVRE